MTPAPATLRAALADKNFFCKIIQFSQKYQKSCKFFFLHEREKQLKAFLLERKLPESEKKASAAAELTRHARGARHMVELEQELRALCAALEALERHGPTTERPLLRPILHLMRNHLRLLADTLRARGPYRQAQAPAGRGHGGGRGGNQGDAHGPAGVPGPLPARSVWNGTYPDAPRMAGTWPSAGARTEEHHVRQ